MPRRRAQGRGPIDREVLIFTAIILLTGFFVGFLLGRKSVSVEKSRAAEKIEIAETSQPAPVAKEAVGEAPKESYPEVAMEAPHGERSVFSYLNPFAKKELKGPRIAIVIDDVGAGDKLKDLVWALPQEVTLAILPQLSHSQYFAYEGRKRGYQIILHQPMEPLNAKEANDVGMIRANMKEDEIRKILDQNLKSVPKATGINNHRGSKVTQDRRMMQIILDELKARGLFFLDSMTSADSVGWREAAKLNMPNLKRDVFLDNELDPSYIRHQFEDLMAVAKKRGFAIGIGHYKTNTLTVLKSEIQYAEEAGFQFVQLKDLL